MGARKKPETERASTRFYDLTWIDHTFYKADLTDRSIADYERKRRFLHPGAAIAWARRQLFHGRVYGHSIQIEIGSKYAATENRPEHDVVENVVDITLAGFQHWRATQNWGSSVLATLDKLVRNCRLEAL